MKDDVLDPAVRAWARKAPARVTAFAADRAVFGEFWRRADELLARLPAKPRRTAAEAAAAAEILSLARESRALFARAHASAVYPSRDGYLRPLSVIRAKCYRR